MRLWDQTFNQGQNTVYPTPTSMQIEIIGTGPVGGSLAKNLAALGHQVKVTYY